jgi:hypothetical protein
MGLLNRLTTHENKPKKGGLLQRAKEYRQEGSLDRPAARPKPKKKPKSRP